MHDNILKNAIAATDASENPMSEPIEGFKSTWGEIQDVLARELAVSKGEVQFVAATYKGMETHVFARGRKDPNNQGTVGFIVHPNGQVEELPHKQKISQLNWHELRNQGYAIAFCYLNNTGRSVRVYKGATIADLIGVEEQVQF